MDQNKNAASLPVRINNDGNVLRAREPADSPRVGDEALAAEVARGGSDALEVLYDRYASTVLGVALKILGERSLAEDVLQETFWRVWKNAATYQPALGTFTSWLFRIARNLAVDLVRRQRVRPQALQGTELDGPALDEMPDPAMDVPAQAQALLAHRQIRKALAALPEAQRRVIEMAYFYGMTRQEIAEATGEALGTIHTRARLALQKLQQELAKEEFEG
jgi:RNA polymerase sigma-70 factor (ECF subfamily)